MSAQITVPQQDLEKDSKVLAKEVADLQGQVNHWQAAVNSAGMNLATLREVQERYRLKTYALQLALNEEAKKNLSR